MPVPALMPTGFTVPKRILPTARAASRDSASKMFVLFFFCLLFVWGKHSKTKGKQHVNNASTDIAVNAALTLQAFGRSLSSPSSLHPLPLGACPPPLVCASGQRPLHAQMWTRKRGAPPFLPPIACKGGARVNRQPRGKGEGAHPHLHLPPPFDAKGDANGRTEAAPTHSFAPGPVRRLEGAPPLALKGNTRAVGCVKTRKRRPPSHAFVQVGPHVNQEGPYPWLVRRGNI